MTQQGTKQSPTSPQVWWRRRWAVFWHDVAWVPLVIWLAFQLRFNFQLPPDFLFAPPLHWHPESRWILPVAIVVQALVNWAFGLYRGMWRYASLPDLVRLGKSVLVGAALFYVAVFLLFGKHILPRSVLVLYPLLLAFGLAAPRLLYRWWKDHRLSLISRERERTMVIGAGHAGELLVRNLLYHKEFVPVVMLDDDPAKQGKEIHGVRVKGRLDDLGRIAERYAVDRVFLAIPSMGRPVVTRVLRSCREAAIPCRTLPSIRELADGRVEVSRLRPFTVEDLLGRDPVNLDNAAIAGYLQDRSVLVTGGGGSIGAELCRQIGLLAPSRLIVLEQSEFNLYTIEQDLRHRFPDLVLDPVLGDIKDPDRMTWLFARYRPQVVFHAAAYKHVPIIEEHPIEGIRNNIIGTRVLATCADRYQCERLVLISTDKSVNPQSVMGATKRVAEIYCRSLNSRSSTRFLAVRFGNVLNSAGSVVPLFQRQIDAGGPVTITHPEVTRYFMTIPEASGLVLQAGAMGEGGEIFVLDMGEPIKIRELAEQMILLSGLTPEVDVPIRIIGLRPGEKLAEELFHGGEVLQPTRHPKVRLATGPAVDWEQLLQAMDQLQCGVADGDPEKMFGCLQQIVPEFIPERGGLRERPHSADARSL